MPDFIKGSRLSSAPFFYVLFFPFPAHFCISLQKSLALLTKYPSNLFCPVKLIKPKSLVEPITSSLTKMKTKSNNMKHYNKTLFAFFCGLALLLLSTESLAQGLTLPRGSQSASVSQRVGITDITINYSRPQVNDREVWGALVPYGMNNLGFGTAKESPWRAGANENTTIEFSHSVNFGGTELDPGVYGLHIEVKEDGGATIILSNNSSSWGSFFYDPSEDAARQDVQTAEVPHREFLTFEFIEVDATSATAALIWEKKQIPFKIEVPVTEIVMASIKDELRTSPGFNHANWNAAANYAMNNTEDMDLALSWADNAIAAPFIGQKNYANLQTKAGILAKMGKTAEADAVMQEAMPLGTVFQVHQYGRTLIAQGDNDKALEVFKWNAKQNDSAWPTNYGLARAYSAKGDYKTALKYLKIAHDKAPAQVNKDRVAANIKKLENNEDIN